jgi:hypothetical protein
VIRAYWAYFAASALTFASSAVVFFWIWKRAVPVPDAAHPAALTSHGQTAYVTAGQSGLYHSLLTAGLWGVAGVFVIGFLLQFAFKVPVFGDDRPP